MKKKDDKTNVMRILEQNGIPYTAHAYPADGPTDGVSVANILGKDVEQVFKTLVTKAASGNYYVFDNKRETWFSWEGKTGRFIIRCF